MSGLMIRDFMILKARYLPLKTLAFAGFSFVFSVLMGFAGSSLLSVIAPLSALSVTLGLFATDDTDAWHVFLCTCPISLKIVVLSRYIVVFGTIVAASAFGFILNLITFAAFREQEIIWYFAFTLAGLVGTCASALISMPFCYWSGASGSNIGQIVPFLFLGGLAAGVRAIDIRRVASFLFALSPLHYFIAIAVILVLGFIASAAASAFLYRQRLNEGRFSR